jgi:hypothetical protein
MLKKRYDKNGNDIFESIEHNVVIPLSVKYCFDVAHVGWECDSRGFIVEDNAKNRFIILTSHGSPYFATEKELDNLVATYVKLASSTVDAMNVLKGTSE